MNKYQHLLLKLMEECAEISIEASKTSLFGSSNIKPGQPLKNTERCHYELDDLQAIIEMLNDRYNFNYTPNRQRIEEKKIKVDKFLSYSIALGLVNNDAVRTEDVYLELKHLMPGS